MTSAVQPSHQSPPPINHNGELDMTLNNNVIEKVTQAVEKCKIDDVNTNTTNCNGDGSKSE